MSERLLDVHVVDRSDSVCVVEIECMGEGRQYY